VKTAAGPLVRDVHKVSGVAIVILPLALLVGQEHGTLVGYFYVSRSELCSVVSSIAEIPKGRLSRR
jgi:hypothetical protein